MLGNFVHNSEMVKQIATKNLIVLNDQTMSRYELVKNNEFQSGDVLILSAHGTDRQTIALARSIGYTIVDTTCEYVYKTHDTIQKAIEQGRIVIYLGKKNHPEAVASIAINPERIHLITNLEELEQMVPVWGNQPITVTNQTTLSQYDLADFYSYIQTHFSDVQLCNDICLATQQRQEALMQLQEPVDAIIVVGDQKSNNSQQLLKIALTKTDRAYLINSLEELKRLPICLEWTVAVTSGASTPTNITNQIIQDLEQRG